MNRVQIKRRPSAVSSRFGPSCWRKRAIGVLGRSMLTTLAAAFVLAHTPSSAATPPRLPHHVLQSAPGPTPSTAAFDRGMEAFERGDYEGALLAFQEADRLGGPPALQYNIGRCHEALGQVEAAIFAYRTYLQHKPEAPEREEIRARMAKLTGQPAPMLRTPASQQAGVSPRDTGVPVRRDGRGMIITGGIVLGAGVATAIFGATGSGIMASRRSDALEQVTQEGNPDGLTFARAQELQSEGQRYERLGAALAGTGVAVGMLGAVLMAIGARRNKAAAFTNLSARCLVSSGACLGLEARF